MTAWPRPRVEAFRREFYNYLQFVRINSKDRGQITLGDNLFESQIRYADAIFDSLANGIHDIKHLKSRQLGISTFSWAFDLFWLGMFDGLEGVLILDTAFNLEKARMSLNMMIDNLPKTLGFPSRDKSDGGSSNRSFIKLSNNSVLSLLSAGIRETKTGGGLGRSLGVNFVHASELCNWANTEGLESFRNSLSTDYENRLYLYESTGRGYNDWWKMWNAAKKDPHHQRCHFTGWWGKDSQRIQRGHPDFLRYAETKLSDDEKEKIAEVEKQYGWNISLEQLAWFRRHVDPSAKETGEEKIYEASSLQLIEQPWVEEDCFAQNSDNFFDPKDLTDGTNKHGSTKFKAYYYYAGMSFDALKITKAANIKSQALKVWEEPEEEGVYVIAVDPAYGISERNDRSCVQVFRCYSDALEQVAEYVSPLINTKQLAWVVAHLLGWYDNCYLILELNGPGDSVWRELKDLKKDVKNNTMYGVPLEDGIFNVFGNVRNFVYTRSDSIYAGKARQMKCLDINTKIPTPSGWTTMFDLEPGSEVLDENGHPCKVIDVSHIMTGEPCYEVGFEYGPSIITNADHLWDIHYIRRRGVPIERFGLCETKDLAPNNSYVKIAAPLELPEKEFVIPPYVLGVWLGDGSSTHGRFYSHADDMEETSRYLEDTGEILSPVSVDRTVSRRTVIGLTARLRSLGLYGNKHIPEEYLRGSFKQRLELLRGLMDTDGTVGHGRSGTSSQCMFITTSEALSSGFSNLVRSLGMKSTFHAQNKKIEYNGKMSECSTSYHHYFAPKQSMVPFKLKRKIAKLRFSTIEQKARTNFHKIVSVKEVESVPVKCILVDNPTHLFLVGEGLVPTHNTTGPLKVTFMERMRDYTMNGMLMIRSLDCLEEMRTMQRDGDSISASGANHDDRVLATALAVLFWDETVRQKMTQLRRTREREQAKRKLSLRDMTSMYTDYQMGEFFAKKRKEQIKAQQQATKQKWRGR